MDKACKSYLSEGDREKEPLRREAAHKLKCFECQGEGFAKDRGRGDSRQRRGTLFRRKDTERKKPCARTRGGLWGISSSSHSLSSSQTLPAASGLSQGSVILTPLLPVSTQGIPLEREQTLTPLPCACEISRMSSLRASSCRKTCCLTPCLLPP